MNASRNRLLIAISGISLLVLSACGGGSPAAAAPSAQSTSNAPSGVPGDPGGFGEQYRSAYLDISYENALPSTMQLIIGTMNLEDTPNALTADQAKQLLPLYAALKGNALQNPAEISAVWKQVEGDMTPAQMQAIVAMKLTRESMTTWAKSNGVTIFNGAPGGNGQGGFQGTPGAFGQGGGPGNGQGGFQGTPDPTRVALRAELQNMAPEARATRLAELGIRGPGGGQNRGRFMATLLEPLIQLLTKRAGS